MTFKFENQHPVLRNDSNGQRQVDGGDGDRSGCYRSHSYDVTNWVKGEPPAFWGHVKVKVINHFDKVGFCISLTFPENT